MQLVVVGIALEVIDCLLPVRREDVLVLPIETLMDVCPRARVELCRRITLGGQLVVCDLVLVDESAKHDQSCRWISGGGQTNRCARA